MIGWAAAEDNARPPSGKTDASAGEKSASLHIVIECACDAGVVTKQFYRSAPRGARGTVEASFREWQAEGQMCVADAISVLLRQPSEGSGVATGEKQSCAEGDLHLSRQVETLQQDVAHLMVSNMKLREVLRTHSGRKIKPHICKSVLAKGHIRALNVEPQNDAPPPCSLRIIAMGGLSDLQTVSALHSAIKVAQTGKVMITVAVGNFLLPLSSVDFGEAMINVMNHASIDYAVMGIRDTWIPVEELTKRVSEFHGTVLPPINSNLPGRFLPKYKVIEVQGAGQVRRIGLVGLIGAEGAFYLQGTGAQVEPVFESLIVLQEMLIEQEKCDIVIPITSQNTLADKDLACKIFERDKGKSVVPLIIGGNERDPILERTEACLVAKPGTEGQIMCVIDIAWPPEAPANAPDIVVEFYDTGQYPRDAAMDEVISASFRALEKADRVRCLEIPPACTPLSSVGIQHRQTTLGTLISSYLRDFMSADAVIIDAGSFLDGQQYPSDLRDLTCADLKRLVPSSSVVCIVPLLGEVLLAALVHSHSRAPRNSMGFLQTDDLIHFEGGSLIRVGGKSFQPSRVYRVGLLYYGLSGMNGHLPLIDWADCNPQEVPCRRAAHPLKDILLVGSRDELAKAHSRPGGPSSRRRPGALDAAAVKKRLCDLVGGACPSAVSDVLTMNVMSLVTLNHDGLVDAQEFNTYAHFFKQLESIRTLDKTCSLRIISVNDVYELANLPFLDGVIRAHMRPHTITMLAGDFLAPSLLSSLDRGRGMIDMLNHVGGVGIQYVCIGVSFLCSFSSC